MTFLTPIFYFISIRAKFGTGLDITDYILYIKLKKSTAEVDLSSLRLPKGRNRGIFREDFTGKRDFRVKFAGILIQSKS